MDSRVKDNKQVFRPVAFKREYRGSCVVPARTMVGEFRLGPSFVVCRSTDLSTLAEAFILSPT
jgi:hypothetical protein